MENPYASPGSSEQTSAEEASLKLKLHPAVSAGLVLLSVGFALSAAAAAINGWLLAVPGYLSSASSVALYNAMWLFAKVNGLSHGVGYLLCCYAPRKSNAIRWAIAAAVVHLIGMAGFGELTDTAMVTVACLFAAPVLFWVFLHRIAKWAGSESLRLLKSHLAWVGSIGLGATFTSDALLMLAETADQFRDSMRVVGIVGGISATAAWTYYAWTTWQFRRQLR